MVKVEIGDTIKILYMKDEPEYTGRIGVVEHIDDIGQLHGTWGGLAVNEDDDFIVTKKANSKFIIGECVCPLCGSSEVNYGSSNLDDNVISYECECNKCGATWNEDYTLCFAGVSKVFNKEGKQLANVLNLNGEEECPVD